MEIGIIITIILLALAYALSRTSFGTILVEFVKLSYAALRLAVFVAVSFSSFKRRRPQGVAAS